MAEERVQRRLAAVLAADVVEYSRLMGEDEEGTLAALKANRTIIDGLISDQHGRIFHTAGDSVIAEFASAVEAVRCAVEIQLALEKANADVSEDRRFRLRIGVHLGDVMVDGENLIGDGVNIAARLEGLAQPGGLCLSNSVLDQVRDRLSLDFLDLGEHRVKNISRPVKVYRVPLASEPSLESPFRGLDVFEYEHANFFFGRSGSIAAAKDRLESQANAGTAFLLIYGMSGSGKSSLLRAGLLPKLCAHNAITGIALWRRAVVRPSEGGDLFTAVAAGLVSTTALPSVSATSDDLASVLRERPDQALGLIRDALAAIAREAEVAPSAARLVLAVDQLEELFTGQIDATTQAAFVHLLKTLASSGHVWVVATMRGDFYPRCSEIRDLAALKDGLGSYELLPPTGPEIAQMIREPARAAGLTFEDDPSQGRLDDVLQQAAMRDPASLPLLEFVLDALYEAGKTSRRLTFAAYHTLGGLEGAIARRADEVVSRLPEPVQDALPAVLRSLVTVRLSDATVTARPSALPDSVSASQQRALVDALLDARLLVGGEGPDGTGVVRLVHEALLSRWPRAARIIEADREHLATRARVQADARRWLAEERSTDLLLPPGKRLAEAEDVLLTRKPEIDDQTIAYIEASISAQRQRLETAEATNRKRLELEADAAREREAATYRLARRTQIAAAITLILAIAAGAGAVVGFRGQQEATRQAELAYENAAVAEENAARAYTAEQEAKQQAAAALAARDETLVNQSLFLASLSRQRTAGGDTTTGILLALEGLTKEVAKPDRPYVAEAEAALYDAILARRETAVLRHRNLVSDAKFSPQGDRIATASVDRTARVWDVSTGEAIVNLLGHSGTLERIAFSPDGRRIVTASRDDTARLWDATTGREIAVLSGLSRVLYVAFSPDGARIVTTADRGAQLWDAETGNRVTVLRGHGGVVSWADFSPDGTQLVTAGFDRTARIWNVSDGQEISVLRHPGAVVFARFSPDGSRIVTTSFVGNGHLWDAETHAEIATLRGHKGALGMAAFSPDSSIVATVSVAGTARLWDAADGTEIGVLGPDGDGVRDGGADPTLETAVAFSPDGDRLVVASRDGRVRLWDVPSQTQIAVFVHDDAVEHVEFSPDGSKILSASHDSTARLWDVGGTEISELQGHVRTVARSAFSSDGGRIVTASADKTARLWNTDTGAEIAVLSGHERGVTRAVFSPEDRIVATASGDGTARLWDANNGAELAVLVGHEKGVRDVAFSPDGGVLATAADDGTARLWNTRTGAELAALVGHDGPVVAIAFSPDGSVVATGSRDGTARLWAARDGVEQAVLEDHDGPVNAVSFSPDGTLVATASDDRTVRIWVARGGALSSVLQGDSGHITGVSFSFDGSRVVTASRGRTAHVWDLKGSSEPVILAGHQERVTHAAFSPNGRQVVTASRDQTARLWDAASGAQLAELPGHSRPVRHVTFSPDGRKVVTTSGDKIVRVFNVYPTTQDLIDRAKDIVGRDLTACERQRFFLPVEGKVGNCPN